MYLYVCTLIHICNPSRSPYLTNVYIYIYSYICIYYIYICIYIICCQPHLCAKFDTNAQIDSCIYSKTNNPNVSVALEFVIAETSEDVLPIYIYIYIYIYIHIYTYAF